MFWSDRQIASLTLSLWWVSIIVGYLWVFLRAGVAALSSRPKVGIVIVSVIAIFYIINAFADTLTIYLCGIVLLFVLLAQQYLMHKPVVSKSALSLIFGLIAISLVVLPVPINRIVITMPSLSAGTYLSLHESVDVEPRRDALFLNRVDQYNKLVTNFGAQVYFTQPHEMPVFKIYTLREGIKVQILSVRYDTRLAYLKIPLLELSGEDLLSIKVHGENFSTQLKMEDDKFAISQLRMQTPSFFILPHLVDHDLPFSKHVTVIVMRLLIWMAALFAIMACYPIVFQPKPSWRD